VINGYGQPPPVGKQLARSTRNVVKSRRGKILIAKTGNKHSKLPLSLRLRGKEADGIIDFYGVITSSV
jgi:hypothetical protein